VYKDIRPDVARAHPFWPLGLPAWNDTWIAHGLRGRESTFVAVWRRGSASGDRTLVMPHLRGVHVEPEILHSGPSEVGARWDAAEGALTVLLPHPDTAVVLRLRATS
jgi:alpha-galactosidase